MTGKTRMIPANDGGGRQMLNRELIESEFSFLGEDIFLNVSSVVMPPLRVQ